MGDKPNAIDTPFEVSSFAIAFVVIGMIGGGIYVFNSPSIGDQVYALTHDKVDFSGNRVVFKNSYDGVPTRDSINKIYSDTDTEYGWCMRIKDGTVQNFEHFKGLNKTTPEQIRFSCSSVKHNSIMHTHPGKRGATALSDQDKESLRTVDWIDVSCVVGSEIDVMVIKNPSGIKCFEEASADIERLNVFFE